MHDITNNFCTKGYRAANYPPIAGLRKQGQLLQFPQIIYSTEMEEKRRVEATVLNVKMKDRIPVSTRPTPQNSRSEIPKVLSVNILKERTPLHPLSISTLRHLQTLFRSLVHRPLVNETTKK